MEQICELIDENLTLELAAADIGDDESLIGLGMDSLSFMKMIIAIEMKFNVEVDDEYLFVETIDTKNKIHELLERITKNDAD
jgi:acyl carrier protein